MSIEVAYHDRPGYLFVEARGEWRLDDTRREIENIRREADRRGYTRLLVDSRELSAPDTEMTRFYTGEHIAEFWRRPLKVASLALPEIINNFAENVAVNRGAHYAVFTDEQAAIDWLLQGSGDSGSGDSGSGESGPAEPSSDGA
ncbi:MAG: hypothetical protein RIC55_32085 [Pirellulaceae bacterium]